MQLEFESGLKFQVDQSNLTATLINSPQSAGHVQIPRVVSDNGYTYSVTGIGLEAFRDNRDVLDVFMPEDSLVTTIESFAFTHSAIQKITIPAALNTIDIQCFEHADELVEIEVSDMNPFFEYIDDKYLVQKTEGQEGCELIFARRDLVKAVIPKNVIKIAPKAFYHCAKLKSVSFDPDGCMLKEIGKRAFNLCKNLEMIQPFPPCLQLIDDYCFSGLPKLTRVEFLGETVELREDCFFKCKNLSLASFPNMKKLTMSHKAFHQASTHFVKLSPPDMEIIEI